ncbi:hypothetical protein R3W88_032067 [Solanum pinnatisectum]|uniref:Gag-pol polyprotein n=1 Tax=Solanum pinnatisectum TaxID=50273 RepID=A0AAV9LN36_9SOLN|nr:hypothetical protein R3W88_032067 [Solanum pinnatisectum]
MVADMRSRMSLFVAGLSRLSSKEGKATMLICDMNIARLMVYVQQVEEEKLRDREEFKNKRANTGNEISEPNLPILKVVWHKGVVRLLPALSVVGTTQVHVVRTPLVVSSVAIMVISCENVHRTSRVNGNGGNRAEYSSVAPPDKVAPRGATSGTGGGTNCLYAINSCQEQEDSFDVVTSMI